MLLCIYKLAAVVGIFDLILLTFRIITGMKIKRRGEEIYDQQRITREDDFGNDRF